MSQTQSTAMIRNSRDLSPDQKAVIESILGRPILDSEEIIVRAIPALEPSEQKRGPDKPWMECAGELADLHTGTARIERLIADEFEQIDPNQ